MLCFLRLKPYTYVGSVIHLVAHLVGTGLIFVVLFTVGWLVSYVLAGLHAVHPFQPDVLRLLGTFELWLVYIDAAFSLIVLITGMAKFCRDLMEERS
jgi:hypothetical protein